MIYVSELWHFSEQPPAFRVLKPWWDVFTDILSFIMILIAVSGCTVQVMDDRMYCLPQRSPTCPLTMNHDTAECCNSSSISPTASDLESKGVDNNLDLMQYKFIHKICYQTSLHWFPKVFPYMVLMQTIIFIVCSNFWFKFPESSSKIEHFVSILGKCFESPWTTRALSEVSGEHLEDKEASPGDINLVNSQSVSSTQSKIVMDKPAAGSVLDKKECEQAKALFERIKKFRLHVEESNLLSKTYIRQTIMKVFMFIFIIVSNGALVPKISIIITCNVDIQDMTGYKFFCCIHNMAGVFIKLSYFYLFIVVICGAICLYTTYWLFHRSLKEYSFDYVRKETGVNDIPDVRNDFAFLLHMMDQYDQLYSKRFAIFLSEVTENKLRQLNLNHVWSVEKLRRRLQTNASGRLELQLIMLPGLPDALFELAELQAIKMELINNVTIPAAIEQLEELKELSLYQCSLRVDTAALPFLKANLKVLRVWFVGAHELPYWLYVLRNLEELHLIGSLRPSASRIITLESLQELRCLKTLLLKSNVTKIPQAIVDVSSHLQRLYVHNDGTKLVTLNSLKKMVSLSELELVHCDLECIPYAIFSLVNLQSLDLRENKLASIEGIVSFQHLPKFTCLKLWHNSIAQIPEHIKKLVNLERLFFSFNKIEVLPVNLFCCSKLLYLDLSHNDISFIPPEIRFLQNLQYLSVTSNKITTVPDELFLCRKLNTLKLGNNALSVLSSKISDLDMLTCLELKGNHLVALPSELGSCPLLKRCGLLVEYALFETLPLDVREKMTSE
ncbi:hypothetical protein AALO_G00044280 [Alosa alosa]|uniref:LRRC8 pannexin-like TM region domain-containing protein n=1 Tax=Alosa alosa TaxID=278164 RepID=A0AAV6H966_9TELE|nr:volume-regulated anion channel subunit LRRC8C-like [Alosa alosa]KAG5283634.1 hypothetical protein AALO_G00044280 [Alosa alosa]